MSKFLLYQQDGPVVTLTMNQPDIRNVLTGNTAVAEFVEACARITSDRTVKVLIITGAGSAFSAGGNVKDMRRFFEDDIAPAAIREEYRQGIQRIPLALYNLDVPTIAAVNGAAIGAGCDLACMCDIRIASESAKFAESFVKVGLVAGDAVDAGDALECGLVSRVVPADKLMDEARALAGRIARNPGPTMRMTKRLLREGQHMKLDTLLEMSAGYQALAHKTPQHKEAVMAFIEKRKPVFTDD